MFNDFWYVTSIQYEYTQAKIQYVVNLSRLIKFTRWIECNLKDLCVGFFTIMH